jgi:hypothetical protein
MSTQIEDLTTVAPIPSIAIGRGIISDRAVVSQDAGNERMHGSVGNHSQPRRHRALT